MLQALKDTFTGSNLFKGAVTATALTALSGSELEQTNNLKDANSAFVQQLSDAELNENRPNPVVLGQPEFYESFAQNLNRPSPGFQVIEKKEVLTARKYLSSLADRSGFDANNLPTDDQDKRIGTSSERMLENYIQDLKERFDSTINPEKRAHISLILKEANKMKASGNEALTSLAPLVRKDLGYEANKSLATAASKQAFFEIFDLLKAQSLNKFSSNPVVTHHLKNEMSKALEGFKVDLNESELGELQLMIPEIQNLLIEVSQYDTSSMNLQNSTSGVLEIEKQLDGSFSIERKVPIPLEYRDLPAVDNDSGIKIDLGPEGQIPRENENLPSAPKFNEKQKLEELVPVPQQDKKEAPEPPKKPEKPIDWRYVA